MNFTKHRFKAYRQVEENDCASTCLKMIAYHYGCYLSDKDIRARIEPSRLGVSIKDLCVGLKSFGIESYPIIVGLENVKTIPCPAILFFKEGHFVVLYSVSKDKTKFHIADPAKGKITLSYSDLENYWCENGKGIAILTNPGTDFEQRKSERRTSLWIDFYKSYKSYLLNVKGSLFFIVALSIICLFAELLIPFVFKRTIDDGLQLGNINVVWGCICFQLAIFIGSLISSNLITIVIGFLGIRLNRGMIFRYLTRLLNKGIRFFDTKSPADLIQKMNDQRRIKDFLLSFPNTFFLDILSVIVFSVVLIYFNPLIFVVFTVIATFELLWNVSFLKRRHTIDYLYFGEAAKNGNIIQEVLMGINEIVLNNAQDKTVNQWSESQSRLDEVSKKSLRLNTVNTGGSSIISYLKGLVVTGICATMVVAEELSLGSMMTIGYLIGRLSSPFASLANSVRQIQDIHISHQRLSDVLEDSSCHNGEETPLDGSIKLRNVWFKYAGTNKYVIKNINLDIKEGQTVALVGESGCGKTTLIKLMLGLYAPDNGVVKLGGVLHESCNLKEWSSISSAVMQNGYIFSDSVLGNIAIADDRPDVGLANEVLNAVGLMDFINSLPMGINTRIGRTGLDLSGGQKQRLLIARALYRNPKILFLDEATSSLDASNEMIIHRTLTKYNRRRTVIIAAHRLSTVKNADRIIVIKDGEIIEEGTHDELISINGEYHTLVCNQLSLSND